MNKEKVKKIIKELLPYVIIVIVVLLIRAFIITPARVDGSSMEPTLNNNNIVLLDKTYSKKNIKRFDIVVVKLGDERIIKRVIALPGEHVEYKKGQLYVDGFLVNEDFNHAETHDFKLETLGYLTIPGDKYFVVGDNRLDSMDSRYIGLIDEEDILGDVKTRIFPLNKVGKIK